MTQAGDSCQFCGGKHGKQLLSDTRLFTSARGYSAYPLVLRTLSAEQTFTEHIAAY